MHRSVLLPLIFVPAMAIAAVPIPTHLSFLQLAHEGRAIFDHTQRQVPRYVGDRLNCASCHLGLGKQAFAAPLWGAYPAYPRFQKKAGRVVSFDQRVRECFLFSERGKAPPLNGHTVAAIDAYAYWLAYRHGDRVGYTPAGAGYVPPLHTTSGSVAVGRQEFAGHCAVCHGSHGQGGHYKDLTAPPLWGPHSFAVGAGMSKPAVAARFIWANMPYGHGRTLAPQTARNIADYVDSHARSKPQQAVATLWAR